MSDEDDAGRQTLESVFSGGAPSPPGLESPGRRLARIGERFAANPVPLCIGRYQVIARIGVGGMGEVFSARDPDLDRELAIKLVHAELDDGSASSVRLLREAQTLAHVDHPNVVKIYEVGLFGTRVFLAMEVVHGVSLREHTKLGRPWRELLDVLIQAGRGLHAVHQAGLVHRDVKPDNVMVGDDPQHAARVRVVDFGLARTSGLATDPPGASGSSALADEAASSLPSPSVPLPSRLTASGAVVGTPVYMAPEQLRRPIIDARCDQFGFCVMAWEALAGTRPFPGGSISELFEAHRRGARIPRGSPVPQSIWRALQRGTAYAPEQRWESMLELVHELERVAARRLGGVTTLVSIGAAATVALAWSLTADAARGCTDPVANDRAQRIAAVRAGAVAADVDRHALDGLDARADALASAREQSCTTRAQHGSSPESDRESACLDRAEHRLDALIAALAPNEAEPWGVDALRAIAELPDPLRCSAASEQGYQSPETAELADRIERIRDELDDAWTELALGHAREISGRIDGLDAVADATGYTPLRAEVGWLAGELARELGDPLRARARLLDAAALAEASRHDELGAKLWAALAVLAIAELADVDAGRDWLRRAEVAAARLGPDPQRARMLRLRAAQLARLAGELELARTELEAILREAPSERLLDPSWWAVLGIAADVAEATGALDQAIALHERHRDSLAARLGPEHPDVADAYYNLGKTALISGDLERARAELEHARAIWEGAFGRDHPDLALVHAALQQLETSMGDLERVRAHADEVLRIRLEVLPADHPDLALAWLGVGGAALRQGDLAYAIVAYESALAIEERTLGSAHPETALVRANLAEAVLERGDAQRARALAQEATRVLETVDALDPAVLAFAERVRGTALLELGEPAEADRALARAEALLGGHTADPLELGLVLLERARAHAGGGRHGEARGTLARARQQLVGLTGDSAGQLREEADALALEL